jgi:hypothetical protein
VGKLQSVSWQKIAEHALYKAGMGSILTYGTEVFILNEAG